MRISNDDIQQANLVCFYTKNGAETVSPYEAQTWKNSSTSVYIRLKNMNGNVLEGLVKRIILKHNRNAYVIVRIKQSNRKYELLNVSCDMRVLIYDELYFFVDKEDDALTVREAEDNVIDFFNEKDFNQAKSEGKIISILYIEDPRYSSSTTGIIPNIQEYDENNQIVTTKAQKIFLKHR